MQTPQTPQDILSYLRQLNGYLYQQHQQIQQIDTKLNELLQEIKRINEKNAEPPVNRNEYRFDLLKIERLEGTLNIGINPKASDTDMNIEDFAIAQSLEVPSLIENQHPGVFPGIQQLVNEYLDKEAYDYLKQLELKYNLPLTDTYRTFIVEDVKKQIDARIRDYLKRVHPEDAGSPEQISTITQAVYEDVKRDVQNAFEAYLTNLNRKEKGI
ncbi:spore germination protein GerPC [Cohnella sp. AR92]|uniref:spore germination protein GerPC n=1 Tax=Cohnella sp. AR92 TaxID=648716 RepID=UPI000F8F7FC2|nr:spore germination protein GerPC [Cohnella sp. AR92]RUS46959.1 spore gernimation protein [Cohnella sp. AR92]